MEEGEAGMVEEREEFEEAARRYIGRIGPLSTLGNGVDGWVFSEGGSTAIKVLRYDEKFDRELAAYERLAEHDVTAVQGFAVPKLMGSHRGLRVVEMSIVRPPFLLDFAGARVDEELDFDDEIMEQKWSDLEEMFGSRISVVRDVFFELSVKYGVFYYDFTVKNLNFGD